MHNCSFLSMSLSYAALADSFRLGIYTVHYVIRSFWSYLENLGTFSYVHTYKRNATCGITWVLFWTVWAVLTGNIQGWNVFQNQGPSTPIVSIITLLCFKVFLMASTDSLPVMVVLMDSNLVAGFFVNVQCINF